MNNQSLETNVSLDHPHGRYNKWGERKLLSVPDHKRELVEKDLSKLDLSLRAKSLLWTAQLTESNGYEFVLISDAQFPRRNYEKTNLEFRPCFEPINPVNPQHDDRQSTMMRRGFFIYDGWYPQDECTQHNAEEAVGILDQITSIFSLVGRFFAYWEPKYWFSMLPVETYIISERDFNAVDRSNQIIQSLPNDDRRAIGRSIGWLSNAARTDSIQKFLLLFLSIESLATYIESGGSKKKSILRRHFSSDKPTKSRRNKVRDECIDLIMNNPGSISSKVQVAYHECIHRSISNTLSSHLQKVFQRADESDALFSSEDNGKNLWELRNEIAHGKLNLLSDDEVDIITRRIPEMEAITRDYLKTILSELARTDYFPSIKRPAISVPLYSAVSSGGAKLSQTDMAEYYAGVDAMTRFFIHVHFGDE